MMKSLVSACALLLSVSACGGDDKESEALTADETAVATSISEYWQSTGIAEDPADCIGEKTVRSFGIAHLQDVGAVDDDLKAGEGLATAFSSAADATEAAENNVDCLTLPALMQEQYPGIDDETAECLAEAYGHERYVEAMANTMRGIAVDTPDEVTAEMSKCVPEQ